MICFDFASHLELGFFPGSGALDEVGVGHKGRFHALNMPLADGTDDSCFSSAFNAIITSLMPRYQPEVLVVQCGADGLSGDRKCASFNLTLSAYQAVLRQLFALHQRQPILLLGGGGYHFPNAARLWTLLTALALEETLEEAIPEHEQLLEYGPGFELSVSASARPNRNRPEVIAASLKTILANVDQINRRPVADDGGGEH